MHRNDEELLFMLLSLVLSSSCVKQTQKDVKEPKSDDQRFQRSDLNQGSAIGE